MSRLQFATGAGHRRGRARQTRPMRSRRPPCRRQYKWYQKGVRLTCLKSYTNLPLKSNAFATDKLFGALGSNTKKTCGDRG